MRVLALVALTACSREALDCAAADWSIDVQGAIVRGAYDGSVVIATAGQLARYDAAGNLARMAPLTLPPVATRMWLDDVGAPIVAGDANITRFDRNFTPLWSASFSPQQLDIGPGGDVAYFDQRVHYLDAAGAERWTAAVEGVEDLRIADNGDVLAFLYGSRQRARLAAATGAVIETVAIPALPMYGSFPAIDRSGSFVFVDDPLATVLVGVRDDGSKAWSVPLHAATDQPTLAGDGSFIVVTDIGTAVARLEFSTGAMLALHDNCKIDDPYNGGRPLAGANTTGYVLVTPSTIYRFAGP